MGGKGFRRHGKVVWPGFSYNPRPRQVAKVGRNEPCPCGSGRKYKECHEEAGSAYLAKLAWQEEKRRHKEARRREKGLPWYRRLLGAGKRDPEGAEEPQAARAEGSSERSERS